MQEDTGLMLEFMELMKWEPKLLDILKGASSVGVEAKK